MLISAIGGDSAGTLRVTVQVPTVVETVVGVPLMGIWTVVGVADGVLVGDEVALTVIVAVELVVDVAMSVVCVGVGVAVVGVAVAVAVGVSDVVVAVMAGVTVGVGVSVLVGDAEGV